MTQKIICAIPGAKKWKVHFFLLSLFWLLSGSHLPSAIGAQCPLGACKSRAEDAHGRNFASQFAFGDFDGDRHSDLATVETIRVTSLHTRYWISFQLSTGHPQAIGVTAPSGELALVARDVNGDSAVDLVLLTAGRQKPVAVLLNDGAGNFAVGDPAKLTINFAPSSSQLGTAPPRMGDRAVLGGQSSFQEVPAARRFPPTTPGLSLFFSGSSDVATTLFPSSFLGRAPPFSVLHS
jgi:hypothetical protein